MDMTQLTQQRGITLRGLQQLKTALHANLGEEAFKAMSTGDVKDQWVMKVTEERKCGVLDISDLVAPEDVVAPTYFISHAWKGRFSGLLQDVLAFLQDADEKTAVWLDILCINQHEVRRDDVAGMLDAGVRACSGGTIVVMDTGLEDASPARRAWCVFEWAHTLHVYGTDGLHMPQLSATERESLFKDINIEAAGAGDDNDKAQILATVTAQHGSPAAFDAALKLQLLLEPLSYKVDQRLLLQQAEALKTQWRLEPVDEWLAAGARGERALVITAGAGEGKSTIVAALVKHLKDDSPTRPKAITAHHFLKYNDQRRLEPIRIIKSLAAQLAKSLTFVKDSLLSLSVAAVASLRDTEEAFKTLLLKPLEKQLECAPNTRVVLLIDALDEADPPQLQQAAVAVAAQEGVGQAAPAPAVCYVCPVVCGNKALQLVTTQLSRLPPCVRFIFTTRPDAAAGQVLPCLQRTFGEGGAKKDLRPGALRKRTKGATAGGGVMLYYAACSAYLELLQVLQAESTGQGSDLATATPPVSPLAPRLVDVDNLYGRIFDLTLTSQQPNVRDLLAVLMAAKEPLSESFVHQLGLGAAVKRLPGYGRLFFVDEHHVYTHHKSLGDWLLDAARSGPWAVDVVWGHELLGLHLAKTWRNGGCSTTSTRQYALKYMAAHLATAASPEGPSAAGSDAAVSALDRLLVDFELYADALKAGLIHSVISALGNMRTHTKYSYDVWRWLAAAHYDLMNLTELTPQSVASSAAGIPILHSAFVDAASITSGAGWKCLLVLPASRAVWRSCITVLKDRPGIHYVAGTLAFSPDGNQLACGNSNGIIRIWDAATGQSSATLEGHTDDVNSVAFSPDGTQLASSSDDKTIRIWDAATGQSTFTMQDHTDGVTSVAFSPNGTELASTSKDKTVRVWDAATGQCSATLEGHTRSVNSVVFSPDGTQLASSSDDETIRIWDVSTGQCSVALQGHTGYVTSVVFSPDGTQLASSSYDNTIRIWDAATGQCDETLNGRKGWVKCVAFRPNGSQLAYVEGNTVRFWDTTTGTYSITPQGDVDDIQSMVFSPDGRSIVTGSQDASIRVWDVAAVLESHTVVDYDTSWINSLAFSPDGSQLASGNWDEVTIRLWDPVAGQCRRLQADGVSGVSSVAFSPDGKQLAGGCHDGKVRIWDAATGQRGGMPVLSGHTNMVLGAVFSQDGTRLASCSKDNKIRIWDTESWSCIITMTSRSRHGIGNVVFRPPDAKQLASDCEVYGIQVWDGVTGLPIAVVQGHNGAAVAGVNFSPDGKLLVGCASDNTIRVWDADTLQCSASMQGHTELADSVAFSPDGKRLASGSRDKTIHVWNTATWQRSAILRGHTSSITSVVFSPDGTRLASGGEDNTIRIWGTYP